MGIAVEYVNLVKIPAEFSASNAIHRVAASRLSRDREKSDDAVSNRARARPLRGTTTAYFQYDNHAFGSADASGSFAHRGDVTRAGACCFRATGVNATMHRASISPGVKKKQLRNKTGAMIVVHAYSLGD